MTAADPAPSATATPTATPETLEDGAPDNGLGPTVLGNGDDNAPPQVLGTKIVRPSRTLGSLPMTGANLGTIAAVGAGLIATGAAMNARRSDRQVVADGAQVEDSDTTTE